MNNLFDEQKNEIYFKITKRKTYIVILKLVSENKTRTIGFLNPFTRVLTIYKTKSDHTFWKYKSFGVNKRLIESGYFDFIEFIVNSGEEKYLVPVALFRDNGTEVQYQEKQLLVPYTEIQKHPSI